METAQSASLVNILTEVLPALNARPTVPSVAVLLPVAYVQLCSSPTTMAHAQHASLGSIPMAQPNAPCVLRTV